MFSIGKCNAGKSVWSGIDGIHNRFVTNIGGNKIMPVRVEYRKISTGKISQVKLKNDVPSLLVVST